MRWTRATMTTKHACRVCGAKHPPGAKHTRGLGGLTARTAGRHLGKWIAVVNGRVLASGKTFGPVLDQGRSKSKGREPLMLRIPSDHIHLL